MFDELLAHPGVREVSVLRSRFGFMAFHGGSLEQGTDEIASLAAERAGASCYAVIQPADFRWHIPSTVVDPAQSATLQAYLDHVDTIVSVHGYGRPDRFTTLLLGGRNRDLAAHLGRHLRLALPGYDVVDALESIPPELRGMHPQNPVNRCRQAGVQLELPPRVRGLGPYWSHLGPGMRAEHTEALIDGLAAAAASWETDR